MGGYYYTTDLGDTWDLIAWKVYGNEYRMEDLLKAPENYDLLETMIFSIDQKVWCPYIDEEEVEDGTPDWRLPDGE